MSYPQTSDIAPVPVPIRGMNTRDSLAKTDPNYAPLIVGLEPEPQHLSLSYGITTYQTNAIGTGTKNILAMGLWGSTLYYYYTASTGPTVGLAIASTGTSVISATTTIPTTVCVYQYAGRTIFTSGTAASSFVIYNSSGAAYATSGWTYDDGGGADPIGGLVMCHHKGRVYIFDGMNLYYGSTVGGVTGATTLVDLSTLFSIAGDTITWAAPLTGPTMQADETWLAFGTRYGEILVYAGDYPGATNWQQIGRFKTSRSMGYNSILSYNNDVWLATESGVVSIRSLFQYGSDQQDLMTVSSAINPTWSRIMTQAITLGGIAGVNISFAHWGSKNKIYILAYYGTLLNDDSLSGGQTLFIYNTVSQAWTMRWLNSTNQNLSAHDLCYVPGDTLYLANGVYIMKYNTSVYKDQTIATSNYVAFYIYLYSAYNDLGNSRKTKQITTVEPIIKTDFLGTEMGVGLAADFGRKTSSVCYQPLLTAGGYQSPVYPVGITGCYIQYRLAGSSYTSSSQGLNLYSVGISQK